MGDASPGTALADRYRIERELGRGGMATVYLAEDTKHHRQVAVKVLRPELAQGLGKERFLREIHIAAQLYHPHILPLIDSGTTALPSEGGDVFYYVMPYVEGESLRARLGRQNELTLAESLRILRDVVAALTYAHEHGVVHRDIKPENVLLAGRHALVADFGVAKALTAGRSESATDTGLIIGTPAYMSPEQAAGDRVDHRSDIYAVGVLAYELLAGRPPFSGQPVQQILAAHLTRKPEPLTAVRQTVPPELDQVVMTCLAKRAADRWQTAAELLSRLDAVSDAARPHATVHEERVNATYDRTFRLGENVCRKLNRATLDPRMIGDVIQFLDNEVESDVLVCYLHPTSLDHSYFRPVLQTSPYRGVAPTLYGFEPTSRRGIRLSLDDQIVLLREFVRDATSRLRPSVALLVGFSSGSDIAFRLVATAATEPLLPVDGLLSLSCNVSLETCFVTSILARMNPDDPARLLADLRTLGADATNLDDWVDVHEYLVKIFRKFHGDIGVLQRFASDLVKPFAESGEAAFVNWFKTAGARLRHVRCVFESTGITGRAAQALKLRNLDTGILGEHYGDDSIVIEPNASHFDLMQPARLSRHIDEMVATLRRGLAARGTTQNS